MIDKLIRYSPVLFTGLVVAFIFSANEAKTQTACPGDIYDVSDFDFNVSGGTATVTFTVNDACSDVELSLASYQMPEATFSLPQTLFDSATGTFDPGQTHTLTVDVPDCFHQIDFVTGPVITDLREGNLYGLRVIHAVHGGTEECVEEEATASLTVTKVVVNDNGGTSQVADFTLKVGTNTVTSGVEVNLPLGTYAITETGSTLPGYTATFSGDCDTSGNITLELNNDLTCTITNNDNPPQTGSITVNKVVVNDNGGTNVAADFSLKVGNTTVTSGTAANIAIGTYTVAETGPTSGYTATFSGDCNANGQITLVANANLTCTITNNDNPAAPTSNTNNSGATGFPAPPTPNSSPSPLAVDTDAVGGVSTDTPSEETGVLGESITEDSAPLGGVAAGDKNINLLLLALTTLFLGIITSFQGRKLLPRIDTV